MQIYNTRVEEIVYYSSSFLNVDVDFIARIVFWHTFGLMSLSTYRLLALKSPFVDVTATFVFTAIGYATGVPLFAVPPFNT